MQTARRSEAVSKRKRASGDLRSDHFLSSGFLSPAGGAAAGAAGSAGLSPAGGAAGGGAAVSGIMSLVMHLLNSSVTAAIFLASSSVTLASLSPFCSEPHLFISSLTLSAHALSLQAHILSLNSPILLMASAAPPFLQPANEKSER